MAKSMKNDIVAVIDLKLCTKLCLDGQNTIRTRHLGGNNKREF